MTHKSTVQGIRTELARMGIELTPDALEEILQAGAYAASFIGGSITLDSGGDWGLYIEAVPGSQDDCWVDVVHYDDSDTEAN